MNAEFYICNLSFKYNGSDTIDVLRSKIKNFCDLISEISHFSLYNAIHYCPGSDFVDLLFTQQGETLCDVLTNTNTGHKVLGRDLFNRFQQAFFRGNQSSMSLPDLLELLSYEDDCVCHGILVLTKIPELVGVNQVVSTKDEWRYFRRKHFVKLQLKGEDVLSEAPMSFPFLVIHPDTVKDLDSLLKTHKLGIVKSLSVLNDYFFSDLEKFSGTNPDFMSHFGASHGLDGSSFEGTGDEKFKKSFEGKDHYCEPHLKIFTDDNGTKDKHCRIYFEFPMTFEKIYVGFICCHL